MQKDLPACSKRRVRLWRQPRLHRRRQKYSSAVLRFVARLKNTLGSIAREKTRLLKQGIVHVRERRYMLGTGIKNRVVKHVKTAAAAAACQGGKAAAKTAVYGRKAFCYGASKLQSLALLCRQAFKAAVKQSRVAGGKVVCFLKTLDKRAKFATLSALLVLAVLNYYNYYTYINSFTYVVYLDGEEIGYVAAEELVEDFMAELHAETAAKLGYDVGTRQKITVAYELRKGAVEDEEQVKSILRERIDFNRYAYMLVINNRPALAVSSLEEYERIIDGLKKSYVCEAENKVIQSVCLTDTVEARLVLLEREKLYSAEEALQILKNGTSRREIYLVSRGDTLWSIAERNNLTLSEIQEANPHLTEVDRLMPGDEISLVVPNPLVGVAVTEEVEAEEAIKFETAYKDDASLYKGQQRIIQLGKNGRKKVIYLLTLKNGREIGRKVLSETVIEEPRQQIVARGTKPLPEGTIVGTGRFMWPVAGGGRITSRYGYRWGRFHYGLDIGAPAGTAVVAADGGTVIQSGWMGRYGLLVTIDHHNGYVTKYAHNSSNLVTVGQKVQKGQQIARVGSTGNSTGPHLHFEVIKNGKNVDPLSYL